MSRDKRRASRHERALRRVIVYGAVGAAQVGSSECGGARIGGRRRQLQLARRAHAGIIVFEKWRKRHIVRMVGVETPVQRAALQLLAKRQRGEARARRLFVAAHNDALWLVLVAEPLVVFVRIVKLLCDALGVLGLVDLVASLRLLAVEAVLLSLHKLTIRAKRRQIEPRRLANARR
jgi:hypothetical protein